MKKTKLLTSIICGILLCSCNSKESKLKEVLAQASKDSLAAVQKYVKEQAEEMRQDSLNALTIKGYDVKTLSEKTIVDTKIEYKSLYNLISELKKQAEKEMWTKDKLKDEIETYKLMMPGGQMLIQSALVKHEASKMEMLSAIIKDKSDKEVCRMELKKSEQRNDLLKSGFFWYDYSVIIDKRVTAPFYIYIPSNIGVTQKFEVTEIK